MKKTTILTVFLLAFGAVVTIQSCNKDSSINSFSNVTQAQLDAATISGSQNLSGGTPFGNASVPHNGTTLPTDSTLRDVYSNFTGATAIASNIITKRVYMKNPNGSQGMLEVTFAMVRHETGYWSAGGDYEYIEMPNMGTTNYTANPNGVLPTDPMFRGKLVACQSCHSHAPGNDFLFTK
jgi:hypothetical protein